MNHIVSGELLSESAMLSKVTSRGFMLIVFSVLSCCSRWYFSSCTCQAVSRTVYIMHSIACLELKMVKISKQNRKGHRIEPCHNCVRLTVPDFLVAALGFLKCKIRGFKPPATYLIFTLDLQPGTKSTQPVTSQGCFGRAKTAANFLPNQPTSGG